MGESSQSIDTSSPSGISRAMAPDPGWLGRGLSALLILCGSCTAFCWAPPRKHALTGDDWSSCLGHCNRHQRRLLTEELGRLWAKRGQEVSCSALGGLWRPPQPCFPRRAPRRLFAKQRANWGDHRSGRRQLWSGWPERGRRIGEAANPGPPAPGTLVGGERPYPVADSRRRPREAEPANMAVDEVPANPVASRVYCPVVGCPCADPAKAAGWATVTTMQHHIDSHLAGTLQGEVPAAWLQAQSRQRCRVCGMSVSCRHGVHPTLTALVREALAHAARHLWDRVLSRALAAAAQYNDERSWKELLMLPQCTLEAPPRGGRKHQRAAAAYTADRLQRWADGERAALWHDRHVPRQGRRGALAAAQRRELAVALVREGFERKACNALLFEGLCDETSATARALQVLHPGQPEPQFSWDALPPALELAPDLVGQVLRAFPADTAPGACGLRVQHLREAGQPVTSRASSLTLPKWWASWRKDAFVERQLLSWLALLLWRSLSLEEGCGPLPLGTSCAGLLGSASCAWCGMRP